jgi:hypothetical protein
MGIIGSISRKFRKIIYQEQQTIGATKVAVVVRLRDYTEEIFNSDVNYSIFI